MFDDRKKVLLEARERRLRERNDSDLLEVLKTPAGRRLIWRFMADGGVFRSSFDTNALSMAHKEGMANRAAVILDDLMRVSPNSFSQMWREDASEKISFEKEIRDIESQEESNG